MNKVNVAALIISMFMLIPICSAAFSYDGDLGIQKTEPKIGNAYYNNSYSNITIVNSTYWNQSATSLFPYDLSKRIGIGILDPDGMLEIKDTGTTDVLISSGVGNENATIQFRETDVLRMTIEYSGLQGLLSFWSKYTDDAIDIIMSLNSRTNEVLFPSGNVKITNGGNFSVDGKICNMSSSCYTLKELNATGFSSGVAPWLYNSDSNMYFNESYFNSSVDSRLLSTTYFPTSVLTIYGTNTGGNNVGNVSYYDDQSYNVTEIAGANPLEIRINFTGVTSFDSLIYREWYAGGLGHEIEVQLWNYDSSAWDRYGSEITDQSGLTEGPVILVSDSNEHVSVGIVQFRFVHTTTPGNTQHKFNIDFVQLIDGTSTLTTIEHDSLGGRDSPTNHPWALPYNNTVHNLEMGNHNITLNNNSRSCYGDNCQGQIYYNGTTLVLKVT